MSTIKKIFAVAFGIVFCLCAAVPAFAADAEATWTLNNTHYSTGTFKEGIAAMKDAKNGIMFLTGNVVLDEAVTYESGSCQIDLAGYGITVTGEKGLIVASGANVKITDGAGIGKIVAEKGTAVTVEAGGTLNLCAGRILSLVSDGNLTIGGGEQKTSAEIGALAVNGGSLELIGDDGVVHAFSKTEIGASATVKIGEKSAVTDNKIDLTSKLTAGYSNETVLYLTPEYQKTVVYSGEISTETHGPLQVTDYSTLYIALIIGGTVLLLAAMAVVTVIICKKAGKRA